MHCRLCIKVIPPSPSSYDDHRPCHIKHIKITVFVRLLFLFPFLLKITNSKCHNHSTGAIPIEDVYNTIVYTIVAHEWPPRCGWISGRLDVRITNSADAKSMLMPWHKKAAENKKKVQLVLCTF